MIVESHYGDLPEMSRTAMRVFCCLVSAADISGSSSPRIDFIAHHAGVSFCAAARALQELSSAALIDLSWDGNEPVAKCIVRGMSPVLERLWDFLPEQAIPIEGKGKRASYEQRLLDPRWQRRRLQILHRDSFMCQLCNASRDTLHVHHCAYRRGAQPWEYSRKELVTLCDACHTFVHKRRLSAKEIWKRRRCLEMLWAALLAGDAESEKLKVMVALLKDGRGVVRVGGITEGDHAG